MQPTKMIGNWILKNCLNIWFHLINYRMVNECENCNYETGFVLKNCSQ